MNGPIHLGPSDLALAAVLLLVPAAVSVALRLGLGKDLVVAGSRTVVQLSILGIVLSWVFAQERWYFVLPMLAVMFTAATRAAVKRAGKRVEGAYPLTFASLVLSTSIVTFSVTELVIGVDPWFTPQYIIPLAGMMLGNSLNGISLALGRWLSDVRGNREAIEARLALGADLWHATLPEFRTAVRTGLVPILNSMSVVGLVSLPGMMTGQILAGVEPIKAVAYQILIMFMVSGATAAGTLLLCLGVFRALASPYHTVRWEKIIEP